MSRGAGSGAPSFAPMTDRRRRRRRLRRLAALLVTSVLAASVLAVAPLPRSLTPTASAAAAVDVTQSIPANTLIGRETPVEVTFANTGDTTAYNLAFTVTLPLGITVSSADEPPTRTITTTDAAGNPTGTVVVWENIVDIVPGSRFRFHYSLQHDVGSGPGQWQVDDVVDAPVDAYVNDTDSVRPTIQPSTGGDPVTAVAADFSDHGTAAGSTTLVPVLLTKSEPSPESELLRGVHDHQTVYTLELETGEQGGVDLGQVEDWLPAGLEFLGCGTDDNSRTEEYPGSGPLNPGNAPAAPGCREPVRVETVDSGLPAGLAPGVYTHVVWDLGGVLPASSVSSLQYVAGIPMHENTMTWPGITPPPASGRQGSNLDNNTGPLTTQVGDGTTWTNQAQVATTYNGQDTTVTDRESVQAMDLAIQKTVDTPQIQQGGISTWSLRLRTSEYVATDGVAGLTVTDVTPDGTCPIGSERSECAGTTSPPPSPAYTSTSAHADGTTTLTWDLSSSTIGPNATSTITFSTVALSDYANGDPVSANDSWTNTVDLAADVTTFDERGPDDPAGQDTHGVTDDSSREQSGTSITFAKDVGVPAPGQECGNGAGVTWSPDVAQGVGPGDRVCFRLTAKAPDNLDTRDPALVDFLPPGFRYETDSSTPGPDNEVPPAIVTGGVVSGAPATGQRIQWTLLPGEVVRPAQTAQVVFGAVLDGGVTPDLGSSGDVLTNSSRFSFRNTNGEVFVVPDTAGVVFDEAHLGLTKGITEVDPPTGATQTFPAPGEGEARNVVGGTTVTYTVTVANDGSRDAHGVEVRDLLPRNAGTPGQDATCAEVSAISDGGTCGQGRVTWTGLAVPAGGSVELHYTWTVPDPVPVAFDWTNHAGVVEYRASTDTGTDFTYVPRDNIDPTREPDANTDAADDTARVFTPGITLAKSRTTSISAPGNAASNQATIGETISYTVDGRQPGGTTAQNFDLVDDLTGKGQRLLPGTVVVRTGAATTGDCVYDPPTTAGLTVTGNRIEVTLAGPISPAAGTEGCFRMTFDAVVEDVPDDAGEALNRRPNSVTNTAALTYDFDDNAGGTGSGNLSASVSTQLVEPSIAIDKRSSATSTVLPGTPVTYSLVVTNRSGTAVSQANDVVVRDDFSGVPVSGVVANPDGGTVSGSTITWTVPTLDPGASVTLSYTVRLQDDLVASSDLTNTARATTTSMPGTSGDERTSDSPCSPATCPGYEASDSATLQVAGPLFSKTRVTRLHTVGDEAAYVLRAEFPAGLDFGATSITDDLAGGATTYVRTDNVTCANCGSDDTAAFQAPEDNGTSGGNPRWDLGTLTPSAFTRIYTITYTVRVRDLPATGTGDTLTNTARLAYATGSLSATAAIDIAEPDVTISKRVATDSDPELAATTAGSPKRGAVGDTITYELAITNNGGWTAYDVAVRDVPDTVETGASCTGTPRLTVDDVSDGALYAVTDGTLGTGDSCLGFTVPAILPGDTVTIRYTLDVPDDFPRADLVAGPELVNQASVREYFGLAASQRTGNPDVRSYPATIPTDQGYVDLAGGELGDLVWLDVDADGNGPDTPGAAADPGEPGIAGVDVTVTWFGPDGTEGTADDETLTRTTDADGRWSTDRGGVPPDWLAAGDYRVTIDTSTLPPGLVNTADPDGGTDDTAVTTLAENEVDLTQDFGYAGDQSLGDTVWLDLDGDGTKDAGEPGIPGVDLRATWAGPDGDLGTADDVDYGTVTTGPAGGYTVDHLPAGPVRVVVDPATLPAGVSPTYDLDGGLDGRAVRTLAPGEDATDVDFGYAGTASVGDTVWFDTDGDGVQDPTEPGLPGVGLTVTWWGFDGAFGGGDDVTTTVTTDADGRYLVDHLPAGDVRVTVVAGSLPPGLTQTFDPDGTLDGTTVRRLTAGQADRDADFGYRGSHRIGDLVWLDVDADGNGPDTPGAGADPTEPGVPGQRLRVVWAGADGDLGTEADNVVLAAGVETDADGRWVVTGVPDGVVRVSLTGAPATVLRVTADPDGTLDGVSVRTISGPDLDIDFGLAGTASVGDTVWLDLDADGVQDPGEPGLAGVDVQVTWAGFDGELGTADDVDYGTRTTDAEGRYLVGALPPGDVRVMVDPATLPPGLHAVYDLDGGDDDTAERTLAAAEDARDVDFGYAGSGSIGDLVWWDLDGNGAHGPGEPGLPGIGVDLDWAGPDGTFGTADDAHLATTTDADGGYLFRRLPPGDFRVTVAEGDLPDGLSISADPDGGADSVSELTLADGADDLDQDFGYVGEHAIGDLVWRDTDRDGTRQPREPAVAGARLTVTYLGADGVPGGGDDVSISQRTANPPRVARGGSPLGDDPFYRVDGLVPGAYTVTLDPSSLPGADAPLSDLDGGDPATTDLRISTGDRLDADFAVFRNDAPEFDADAAATLTADCGGTVTVDPLAEVTDANGDRLRLEPGSVTVPDGVRVSRGDDGRLRFTIESADDGDEVTVSWTVSDGRGGTVEVTRTIAVTSGCGSTGSTGGIPLPGTGNEVPMWLVWVGLGLLLTGGALVVAGRRRSASS